MSAAQSTMPLRACLAGAGLPASVTADSGVTAAARDAAAAGCCGKDGVAASAAAGADTAAVWVVLGRGACSAFPPRAPRANSGPLSVDHGGFPFPACLRLSTSCHRVRVICRHIVTFAERGGGLTRNPSPPLPTSAVCQQTRVADCTIARPRRRLHACHRVSEDARLPVRTTAGCSCTDQQRQASPAAVLEGKLRVWCPPPSCVCEHARPSLPCHETGQANRAPKSKNNRCWGTTREMQWGAGARSDS